MKQSPLSRVENIIRRVMEEPFTWLGNDSLDLFQLASHLSRSYEEQARGGTPPTRYTIYVNPADHHALRETTPGLEKQLSDYVALMTARRGIFLSESPRIRFEIDPDVRRNSARIELGYEDDDRPPETAVYQVESGDATQEAIREADAFLILQGRQHIPLDRPVMRIGRRVENDIMLDSPAISRQHVQIRWRQGYFVLYDVSGHSRTSVNGEPVQEHVLRPGDVIALSDIFLVYGEGRDEMAEGPELLPDSDEMDTTQLKPDL